MQRSAAAVLVVATAAAALASLGCASAPAADARECRVRFLSWNVREWRELTGAESREATRLIRSARPVSGGLDNGVECMILPDISYVLEVTESGETQRVGVVGTAPFIHASREEDGPETFQEVDADGHRRLMTILQHRSAD